MDQTDDIGDGFHFLVIVVVGDQLDRVISERAGNEDAFAGELNASSVVDGPHEAERARCEPDEGPRIDQRRRRVLAYRRLVAECFVRPLLVELSTEEVEGFLLRFKFGL